MPPALSGSRAGKRVTISSAVTQRGPLCTQPCLSPERAESDHQLSCLGPEWTGSDHSRTGYQVGEPRGASRSARGHLGDTHKGLSGKMLGQDGGPSDSG